MYKSLFGGKIEFRNRKESLKGLTSLAIVGNLPTILREKAKSILKMKSHISCSSLRNVSPEVRDERKQWLTLDFIDVDLLHFCLSIYLYFSWNIVISNEWIFFVCLF